MRIESSALARIYLKKKVIYPIDGGFQGRRRHLHIAAIRKKRSIVPESLQQSCTEFSSND